MEKVNSNDEVIIKSKKRVRNHGEVFTPRWLVEQMLDIEGVKEACENLEATFLEPSAGEGVFLVAILSRKLEMVFEKYNESLKQYEHYALFALSTIYGMELLHDNVKIAVMNLFNVFYDYYYKACKQHNIKYGKQAVLDSAKLIIGMNVVQGDFLTRKTSQNETIVFNEWKALTKLDANKTIKVIRTEYTLNEIMQGIKKTLGQTVKSIKIQNAVQLDLFSIPSEVSQQEEGAYKYTPCLITDVYKELMERV